MKEELVERVQTTNNKIIYKTTKIGKEVLKALQEAETPNANTLPIFQLLETSSERAPIDADLHCQNRMTTITPDATRIILYGQSIYNLNRGECCQ